MTRKPTMPNHIIESVHWALISNLRWADGWKEERKLFFPGLSLLRNVNVKLLFRTLYLGCLPSIRTRFPSICICTLTKSVGLAINWPNAPAVIPAMTDFLKVITLVQSMSYEHYRTARATEVLISFLWPINCLSSFPPSEGGLGVIGQILSI